MLLYRPAREYIDLLGNPEDGVGVDISAIDVTWAGFLTCWTLIT